MDYSNDSTYQNTGELEDKVEYTADKHNITSLYYDTIVDSKGAFTFLSPTKLSWWLDEAADWMCDGEFVAEIGSGYGELTTYCLHKVNHFRAYYIIDISQRMLNEVSRRISSSGIVAPLQYLHMDIENEPLSLQMGENSLDKVLAVNVLQDVDAQKALRNVHQVLKSQGLFRATFISRETQDVFWENDENYDAKAGRLYTYSTMHQSLGVPPLGYLQTDQSKKPFYRVQKFFTKEDTYRLLATAGFSIESLSVINFPIEMVEERWASNLYHVPLSEKQKSLLVQWNGFPDSYDIVARKI